MSQHMETSDDFYQENPAAAASEPLPSSTTLRVITENFGPTHTFTSEVGRLMILMGTEFVLMLSSVGLEHAEKENMTTILPRHIVAALSELGYGEYVQPVEELVECLKVEGARKKEMREGKKSKLKMTGLTEEELLKRQEELFRGARERWVGERKEVVVVVGESPQGLAQEVEVGCMQPEVIWLD